MAQAATYKPPSLLAQTLADLAPFPGRAALTWRIALLCAFVSATAMLYETPEAAISCYLIIYLMKPDAVQNIGTAIGLIVLVTIVVIGMIPLISATMESPPLRLLAIAGVSFVFLFIGAASQLGEIGGIIALVIAFLLTLVHMAPVADVVSFGLRYAAYMAIMPMALMAPFNLVLGLSPVHLLRQTLLARLAAAAADVAASGASATRERLDALLRADNCALEKQAASVKLLHLAAPPAAAQIARDVRASYRLMLAVFALPQDLDAKRRDALAAAIGDASAAIDSGRMPPPLAQAADAGCEAEREAWTALAILAGAPEGPVTSPPKQPFFAPDALTNPDYQRFALKTTAAAVICYLIYAGIDWQGIHTAMITCYVAALGSTGETVHKLALRICGCLIGAAAGMSAIVFVMPMLETIGGLMVLVFFGVLVGAWVSTGPERISYGGVQIALAFLLTVVQGFGPTTSLDSGWDRIVGILLGNVVIYLIFTRIWPVSVGSAARRQLQTALDALGRLAALPPEQRRGAIPEVALAICETGKVDDNINLSEFEPQTVRPTEATQAAMWTASRDIAALARNIYLSRQPLADIADELRRLAKAASDAGSGPSDAFLARLDRLQTATAR